MAKSVTLWLAKMFLVLAMAPMVRCHTVNPITEEITLYVHVIFGGLNPNVIPVAGAPGQPRNLTQFGTFYAVDVLMTEGVSIDSPPLGRAKGVQVITSYNGTELYLSFSFLFTHGDYKDSSLEVQGIAKTAETALVGELSVVGGTKYFRRFRGYGHVETVRQIAPVDAIVNKWDILLKYDHN